SAQGIGCETDAKGALDAHSLFVHAKGERDGTRANVAAELDAGATVAAAAPSWPGHGRLHARGTLVGPLDALWLQLQGHTDNRGLAFGALVDAPRRTARMTAAAVGPRRTGALSARAAWRGG